LPLSSNTLLLALKFEAVVDRDAEMVAKDDNLDRYPTVRPEREQERERKRERELEERSKRQRTIFMGPGSLAH
jgi:hypothetical protein